MKVVTGGRERLAGFTLLELMIVIAIIAAIAIPNLKEARKAAYEADAVAMLRSIHTAQNLYREQDVDGNGTLDYGRTMIDLVREGLVEGLKPISVGAQDHDHSGYRYSTPNAYAATPFRWCIWAWPNDTVSWNSGDHWFFIDQTGIIRYTWEGQHLGIQTTRWPAIGK